MPVTARILLLADASRPGGENTKAKIRRYRLARLDTSRRHVPEPRYEYLKRTYD